MARFAREAIDSSRRKYDERSNQHDAESGRLASSGKDYFEELQHEMKLVTWPSWKQVRATTGVVLAAVFAFGAYFFVIDNVINKLVQRVYDTFTK